MRNAPCSLLGLMTIHTGAVEDAPRPTVQSLDPSLFVADLKVCGEPLVMQAPWAFSVYGRTWKAVARVDPALIDRTIRWVYGGAYLAAVGGRAERHVNIRSVDYDTGEIVVTGDASGWKGD